MMRLPILIFVSSALIAGWVGPVIDHAASRVFHLASWNMRLGRPVMSPEAAMRIRRMQSELQDVQMDMMSVMGIDAARRHALEEREKALQYRLRAEQIRESERASGLPVIEPPAIPRRPWLPKHLLPTANPLPPAPPAPLHSRLPGAVQRLQS